MNNPSQERPILPLRHAVVDADIAIVDAHQQMAALAYSPYQLQAIAGNLVRSEERRDVLIEGADPMHRALLTPAPDMTHERAIKPSYRDIEIDTEHPLYLDPVVSLAAHGVASRAYYSRPNNATGEAVPGVKPEVFVRQAIAEMLSWVNTQLKDPRVTEFFGGEIELFVEEGWRDPRLQQYLFETVIPNLIRAELTVQHPEMSEEELEEQVIIERKPKIAWAPAQEGQSPAPHETGSAADLTLRYIDTGERIYFGRGPAQMINRTDPDTFLHNPPTTENDFYAAQNLSALYAIMTGNAFGSKTGLVPNPTEFWHWSKGDQLSSIVTGEKPYYSYAPMNGVVTYEPQD